MKRGIRLVAIAIALLLIPSILSACPVCYGAPNSPMTKGSNNGIMFLLGVIGFVQVGFVAMFWSFWRRARELRRRRESFRVLDGGTAL
jgi:hypothetical protein